MVSVTRCGVITLPDELPPNVPAVVLKGLCVLTKQFREIFAIFRYLGQPMSDRSC
jgi:hypothetical protein